MIVDYEKSRGLRLLEAEDTRNFKVTIASPVDLPPAERGLKINGMEALVPIALPPSLPGAPEDPEWLEAYQNMVEKAAGHGWIDSARQSIYAHVEIAPSRD
ncbi:hypothetical protein K1W69_09095 [Hoeflea sp. WL0058]|uniref:Uncharacterized protein n=1 Tax=Flavimaribacter sediminis TaxID=2865987 RepID=A0AAE3D0W0_9HYPH|nr:hypothetical protein [Flavimaribacter sediminis]MBW8637342.1 hypothetical protein [Flavimaribacter sediminis]